MRLATAHFNLHRRLKTFRTATMKRFFFFWEDWKSCFSEKRGYQLRISIYTRKQENFRNATVKRRFFCHEKCIFCKKRGTFPGLPTAHFSLYNKAGNLQVFDRPKFFFSRWKQWICVKRSYLLRISNYSDNRTSSEMGPCNSFLRDQNRIFVKNEVTYCAFQFPQNTENLQILDQQTFFFDKKNQFLVENETIYCVF